MNILFISKDLLAGDLAYLLKKEGHNVKLYIKDKKRRGNFENMVTKCTDWRKELAWVGKNGLIIFDDAGFGKIQDSLRKKGYSVFGGTQESDKLEYNREYAQNIFRQYGLSSILTKNFNNLKDAIHFIKKNEGPWVIKQNINTYKSLVYVGILKNGEDIINVLRNYRKYDKNEFYRITIQKRIFGIEIGVARYFNGYDWASPIEMNIEHKRFLSGNIGPVTTEMGTLAWYDENEKGNKIFNATLNKLKPYLRKVKFKGDIDINCIVNKDGVFPLEPTPRLGSPIIHLHSEIHLSPWAKFLKAVADGKDYRIKWRRGYGIVVLIATPPFPYTTKIPGNSSLGINIYFKSSLDKEQFKHIHFEEVSLKNVNKGKVQFYISDHRGYILYVSNIAKNIKEARAKTYSIIKKIIVPKMLYRDDIGLNFLNRDHKLLKKWGYIK